MKNDLNSIAKLEKAISEKYGEKAAQNPRAFWTDQKESEYIESARQSMLKEEKNSLTKEKIIHEGVLINKKILKNSSNKTCECCKKYSLDKKDDVTLLKYNSCYNCYIKYIEGRESRWLSGWRPTEI